MTPPISYIDRTRAYYQALGYGAPYVWAENPAPPLAPLTKPLSQTRVGLVTTAVPYQPGHGDQGPGAPYNAAAKLYRVFTLPVAPMPDMRISHVAIDRDHTSAEDPGTYFPLKALQQVVALGRIGRVANVIFGLPTNRSQRVTLEQDCPDLLAAVQGAGVEAAVLVPNCPVCHQSVSLAARVLEKAGVPSVVLACARDIVARAGAPRVLFSDFPLGNAAGLPHDVASQAATLDQALDLLVSAKTPGEIWTSPLRWPGDPAWKDDYCNPETLSAEALAKRRAEFDAGKATAKQRRESAGVTPRKP